MPRPIAAWKLVQLRSFCMDGKPNPYVDALAAVRKVNVHATNVIDHFLVLEKCSGLRGSESPNST